MAGKVITGGRAIVKVAGEVVGIFESCSYNVNLGTEAIHILGRFAPTEIAVTSSEAVTLQCTGFRVAGNGVHKLPKFPKLQDLLSLEDVTITVVDRQAGNNLLVASGCKPTSHNGNFNSRATSRITINYTGIKASDEDGDQNEPGATDLP
jgi:hypothetical protein